MAKAKTTELQKDAATPGTKVVHLDVDLAADAGAGLENAGQEAFAIPFLSVLQKTSPQVDSDDPGYVEGARPGAIIETVSSRLYDGKEGVLLLPCAYRRVFLRWGARETGAGFKGEFLPEDIAEMRASGKIMEMDGKLYAPTEDGSVNPKRSDRFADVRNHYCLLVDPSTGVSTQILLSLTSTQIKKSKGLMSMMASVKVDGPGGVKITPATYVNVVRMTTTPESNDKGSWYGVKFELSGTVNKLPGAAGLLASARAFHATVAKGAVAARYEAATAEGADSDAEGF